MAITLETMKSKLHTVDYVRERLSTTEPMSPEAFTVGDAVKFHAQPGWNHGIDAKSGSEPVAVYINLGKGRHARAFQMSKDAVMEAVAAFGMARPYAARCPAELLTPHLNYWFREGLLARGQRKRDFQILIANGICSAVTRQSLLPFSNLALLEQALAGIEDKFNTDDVLVDYKFQHNLRQTDMRLIIPAAARTLVDTGTPDDTWSLGLQIKNSLTGHTQTSVEGYLFRWTCTNGQIDTMTTSGKWTRKPTASEEEVYAWARESVDQVLGGLEPALDAVQALTGIAIDENLSEALRDVFEYYRVPVHSRSKIIKAIEEHDGPITMYVLMNAITQAANEHGLEPSAVEALMRMGGDLPYAASSRCTACRRLVHAH